MNFLISSYNENEREYLAYHTNRSGIHMLATISIHIDRNIDILFISAQMYIKYQNIYLKIIMRNPIHISLVYIFWYSLLNYSLLVAQI